ncbi:hypothetical protein IAT38_008087 [Cryptococcus sp. DSM 104549]
MSNSITKPSVNHIEGGGIEKRLHNPSYPPYPHQTAHPQQSGGVYGDGISVSRFITPGGNPIDNSQPSMPIYHRKFGDANPIGLLGFAGGNFLLNLFNVQARGVTTNNVILCTAMGFSGIVQTVSGLLGWASGNTFAAVAMTSYGSFWLSFAVFVIPQFEVAKAYASAEAFQEALGLYLFCWAIVTFIFLLASLRSSVGMVVLFTLLDFNFWLLAIGNLAGSEKCLKAGGGIGLANSLVGAWVALAEMNTPDTSFFQMPVGNLQPKQSPPKRDTA